MCKNPESLQYWLVRYQYLLKELHTTHYYKNLLEEYHAESGLSIISFLLPKYCKLDEGGNANCEATIGYRHKALVANYASC